MKDLGNNHSPITDKNLAKEKKIISRKLENSGKLDPEIVEKIKDFLEIFGSKIDFIGIVDNNGNSLTIKKE